MTGGIAAAIGSAALRKLVFWALTTGQKAQYTSNLYFAPVPKTVLAASAKTLLSVQK